MRQETMSIYLFEELPEEIQRRAWEGDQSRHNFGDIDFWDFRATLDKFAEIFEITVKWEVDSSRYSFDFTMNPGQWGDLAENLETIRDPLRLAAWVHNNRAHLIRKGKYYSTRGKWVNGKYNYKSRHSRVIFTYEDCPLTGVCFDMDILRAVIDCITYRRTFETYDDLMTTALNEFFETWRAALEYAESLEFYAEEAAANEWEYTADGRRWPR